MRTAAPTIITGRTVEFIPKERPPIITVAEPVSDVLDNSLVGLYVAEVKYSVVNPIKTPETKPAIIA